MISASFYSKCHRRVTDGTGKIFKVSRHVTDVSRTKKYAVRDGQSIAAQRLQECVTDGTYTFI